jgi:hypothetical protein
VRRFDPEGDIAGFATVLGRDGGAGALSQGVDDGVPSHQVEPFLGGGGTLCEGSLQAGFSFVDAGESVVATPPVTAAETTGGDKHENAGSAQNKLPLKDSDAPGEGAIGGLGNAVGDALNGDCLGGGDPGLEAVDFGIGDLMAPVERREDTFAGLRRDALTLGVALGEEADLMGQRREQRIIGSSRWTPA